MAYIMMIVAFLLMTGVALLYYNLLKTNMGEGMMLSAATLIILIHISGLFFQNLQPGRLLFLALGLLGIVITVLRKVIGNQIVLSDVFSVSWVLLFVVLIITMFLYAGDFIQHIDEYHMWAAGSKYMLQYNRLPIYDDFIGGSGHQIGTCIFNYYFQSFSGYNEGLMYVSSNFLVWIGLLLPFSNIKWGNQGTAVLYSLIMYFAIISLFMYGIKNLNVDPPLAGWGGGMAGWMFSRKKKKVNILLLAACILMMYRFKSWAGAILGLFLVLLYILRKVVIEKRGHEKTSYREAISFLGVAEVIIVILSVLSVQLIRKIDVIAIAPESIGYQLQNRGFSVDKIDRTVEHFIYRIFCSGLAGGKALFNFSFFSAFVLALILIMIGGWLYNRREESLLYVMYSIVITTVYLMVVLYGYFITISYGEAIRTSGQERYTSIIVIYLLIIALSFLFLNLRKAVNPRIPAVIGGVLLFIFTYSAGSNFFTNNTALNPDDTDAYYSAKEQRQQVDQIQELIGEDSRVYFLNQQADQLDEFGTNPAWYYMGSQMSNISNVPWKFTASGSLIRLDEFYTPTIDDFANLLKDGGYEYVWIYKADDFLKLRLPGVLGNTEDQLLADGEELTELQEEQLEEKIKEGKVINSQTMLDGQLYKVVYTKKGKVKQLKLVDNLFKSDNREAYYEQTGND